MPPPALIFDLDNTLYPPSRGVVERVDARINRFLVERLGLAADLAPLVRARYRDLHGTTLNGLMLHHAIEPDDFLAVVHEIAVEELLAPDPELHAMLGGLPHRKVVFTNGSAQHAERVLACLEVREHFSDVFSLERIAYVPKPERRAFEAVVGALGVESRNCIFLDDRLDNVATARELGMTTILVGDGAAGRDPSGADATISSVMALPAALATLGLA